MVKALLMPVLAGKIQSHAYKTLAMLLRKGEVHSRLKDNDNISFSKEVAETLGIESAIILEFCKSKESISLTTLMILFS